MTKATSPSPKKEKVKGIPGSRDGLWIIVREKAVCEYLNDPANAGYLQEVTGIVMRAIKRANKKHNMISKRIEITAEPFRESGLD